MTPEIHKQYENLKTLTEALAPILELWEIERLMFEKKATPYADGTLDVILPHYMSIRDMETSQNNLRKALEISRTIGKLRGLLITKQATNNSAGE